MPIAITIQDAPDGIMQPDLTPRLTRATFSTGTHGDESLQISAPMSMSDAFLRYDHPGLPHAIVSDGITLPFQGRVEDTAIRGNGFDLTAFGYSRALSDAPYTALWSMTSVSAWRPVLASQFTTGSSIASPDRYTFDTNNRLYIAPQKGAIFGNTGLFKPGMICFQLPDQSTRDFIGVSFDYEQIFPSASWRMFFQTRNADFSGIANPWAITGGIGVSSGGICTTFAACKVVNFYVDFNAADAVFAGETGSAYLRITRLRLVTTTTNMISTTTTAAIVAGANVNLPVVSSARMYVGQQIYLDTTPIGGTTTQSATVTAVPDATHVTIAVLSFTAGVAGVAVRAHIVYADEIARDLVSTVAALNPLQLSTNTTQIASPARDLFDENYADELPHAIMDRLVGLGDNQTPPGVWEWGVDSLRQLFFRLAGGVGQTWYVDVSAIDVQRSLEQLSNSVYAIYHDANGRALRSAAATDAGSVDRAGLTRRTSVQAETTDLVQATAQRDAALSDRADPAPRFGITFTAIYTAGGGRAPVWLPRAGDTIVIRNLPPAVSPSLNQVQSFRIARTSCDLIARTLTVEPATPLPSLAALLARSLRNQTT